MVNVDSHITLLAYYEQTVLLPLSAQPKMTNLLHQKAIPVFLWAGQVQTRAVERKAQEARTQETGSRSFFFFLPRTAPAYFSLLNVFF